MLWATWPRPEDGAGARTVGVGALALRDGGTHGGLMHGWLGGDVSSAASLQGGRPSESGFGVMQGLGPEAGREQKVLPGVSVNMGCGGEAKEEGQCRQVLCHSGCFCVQVQA